MFGGKSEGEKLTGPEMMLRSVMKAMGVNPDALMSDMATVIKSMTGGLQETVTTLQAIRIEQNEQRLLLETIIRELKIPHPSGQYPTLIGGLIENQTEKN